MCLAQGYNVVTPLRLEPVGHRSRVKHSTTEPLRSNSGLLILMHGVISLSDTRSYNNYYHYYYDYKSMGANDTLGPA